MLNLECVVGYIDNLKSKKLDFKSFYKSFAIVSLLERNFI